MFPKFASFMFGLGLAILGVAALYFVAGDKQTLMQVISFFGLFSVIVAAAAASPDE